MEGFVVDHWEILTVIIALIFNAGVNWKMIKDKPSKEDVENIVNEKFDNHCPYVSRIDSLEETQKGNVANVTDMKTKLNQIDFNVQNICEKLGVTYIGKKNGS